MGETEWGVAGIEHGCVRCGEVVGLDFRGRDVMGKKPTEFPAKMYVVDVASSAPVKVMPLAAATVRSIEKPAIVTLSVAVAAFASTKSNGERSYLASSTRSGSILRQDLFRRRGGTGLEFRKSRAQLLRPRKKGQDFRHPCIELVPGRPGGSERRQSIFRDPIDIAGVGVLLGVLEGLHHSRKDLVVPEPEGGRPRGCGHRFVIEVVQEIDLGGGQGERVNHRIFM